MEFELSLGKISYKAVRNKDSIILVSGRTEDEWLKCGMCYDRK